MIKAYTITYDFVVFFIFFCLLWRNQNSLMINSLLTPPSLVENPCLIKEILDKAGNVI